MTIEDLLIDFDEMSFAPTTLCENPDEYACEWKKQLIAEIERLKAENAKLLDSVESVQAGRCCLRCELTKKAVKEFAEKLKKICIKKSCFIDIDGREEEYWFDGAVTIDEIDELLKEYEV